jgi:hypothetical protein
MGKETVVAYFTYYSVGIRLVGLKTSRCHAPTECGIEYVIHYG